ncbi:SDR family oxidoreductase [Myxococcota bacterium]|nr:SDR family oxidoreductase [Myxococcota bacterium]
MSWALVLGVSSGTGQAAACRLVQEPGLDVFGVHRGNHVEGAAVVAGAAAAAGRRYAEHLCDGSVPERIDEACRALHAQAGPRSVRFVLHSIASASVGTLVAGPGPHLAPRQLQRTFDKMAHSFAWWVQALHRHDLLAPGCHVLGLTNPIGASLIRGTAAITASKAALHAYMRQLAFELGPLGHRVNLLDFGMVESPATQATFDAHLRRIDQVVRRVTPARRKVELAEVAELIGLLAGDRLRWFNGAVIDFTGGEMLAHYDALVHPEPL